MEGGKKDGEQDSTRLYRAQGLMTRGIAYDTRMIVADVAGEEVRAWQHDDSAEDDDRNVIE